MRLSRLEILGFKTFARKLDVTLTGGITSVVGPNGCGKSNVVDSIRWVLGEQRPTQIRLERMEDVIFKGTSTRKPLGMAEVSLTIDNESGRLPINMPEVTITRRLFRSGESEYLINKKTCRLADINDLFMDTGMGTDSYSMFELGMINSILSDKTEDRRLIFEEAAGVTKYKARRKTALTRMTSIEDDLTRVGDIIAELDRHVESLKRQAQKASRYRALRSEIKARTVAVAAHDIAKLRTRIDAAGVELAMVQAEAEDLRNRIAAAGDSYETLSLDIIEAERMLGETAARFNTARNDIAGKEKEQARLDSRIEYLEQTAGKTREAARQNALALDRIAETHGLSSGERETADDRLAEMDGAARELRERFREFEAGAAAKDQEFRALEAEYRLLEKEIASQRALVVTIRVRRESGELRLGEISQRTRELETVLRDTENECAVLREERLQSTGREHDISRAIGESRAAIEAESRLLEETGEALRRAQETGASLRAERDFLAEVIRTHAGYAEGVRNAAGAPELRGRVLSVLGDCVSADDEYALAVEAALGDALQYILVDGEMAALEGARWLSGDTRGRAVFLPAEGNAGAVPVSPDGAGIIGRAADFIRTEARFRPVVEKLLRDVLVAGSLADAVRLHREHGGRYVTLAGEMVGSWGEIHGGRLREDDRSSTLGRREKFDRLDAAHEKISSETAAREKRREELTGAIETIQTSIRDGERALEELRRATAEVASDEARILAKRDASAETLANLRKEAERIRESFADIDAGIVDAEEAAARYEDRRRGVETRMTAAAEEIAVLRAELDTRRTELNAREIERAALTEKSAALAREIETLRERRENLARAGKTLREEIDTAEREMLDAGNRKQELAKALESLGAEHDRLLAAKEESERGYADLRARRSETERMLQNLRREQAENAKKESSLTLGRDEAVLRVQTIAERLSDEFFVTPEDIPPAPDDPDFDAANERLLIEDLRRKIHAVGDVNMAAEDDYRIEKERLDFLSRERDDLVAARRTLDETIQRINHIARERFRETFERIRANFSKTFSAFFEGGVCDLTLEEGEDPLEANILITARPPGKNVRSIGLLSSGERALTAISLLFAIYLVKPSPFCILDEVDAPLDDANIDRYLRVIREFSKDTQFIMVTHNKKTMASADNLYGITMDEPGMSTLVSVKLSQVEVSEKTGATIRPET